MINGFFKILSIALISIFLTLISFFIFDAQNIKNIIAQSKMLENFGKNVETHHNNIGKMIEKTIRDEIIKNEDIDKFIKDSVETKIIDSTMEHIGKDISSEILNIIGDLHNFKYKEKLYEADIDKIKKLDIRGENLTVSVKKGSKAMYTVYSDKNVKNKDKYIKIYKMQGDEFGYKVEKSGRNRSFYIDFILPEPENLQIKFSVENGAIVIEDSIKNLDAQIEGGAVSIKGKNTYPINIDAEDLALDMEFENYDALIEINTESAVVDILGRSYIQDEKRKIINKQGNGKDSIKIKAENAIMSLDKK